MSCVWWGPDQHGPEKNKSGRSCGLKEESKDRAS